MGTAALISLAVQLAQFAPTLLRHLGAGQASVQVATQAVQLAQQLTGASTPEQAVATIAANPDLQADYQRRALEIDGALEQAYLADTQDARARDTAMRQAGQHNQRADWMVLFDAVGLVACLVVLSLFRKDIPGEVVGLLSTIAGIFGLCLRDAHQFEFGSSRSSREKTALIAARGNPGGAD